MIYYSPNTGHLVIVQINNRQSSFKQCLQIDLKNLKSNGKIMIHERSLNANYVRIQSIKITKNCDYPKFLTTKDKGLIVLALGKGGETRYESFTGVCIGRRKGGIPVGEYSTTWSRGAFVEIAAGEEIKFSQDDNNEFDC